jgi:hypothetical protein
MFVKGKRKGAVREKRERGVCAPFCSIFRRTRTADELHRRPSHLVVVSRGQHGAEGKKKRRRRREERETVSFSLFGALSCFLALFFSGTCVIIRTLESLGGRA